MSDGRAQLPTFSVVIPSYGRPERLACALESLAHVMYPHDRWDVIVVDDGSPVPIENTVRTVALPVPARCLRQDNAGPGSARNIAANASSMDYLAFTADDCTPSPDWLSSIAVSIQTQGHERALIGGTVRHALPEHPCPTASHLLVEYLKAHKNTQSPRFFTPNNLAVHRESFIESGGFHHRFGPTGEDREFCDRWAAQGREIAYEPGAVVSHAHPQTLRGFLRQHYTYGVGSARFRSVRTQQSVSAVPEPLGFYVGLVLAAFRSEYPNKAALTALLAASQVVNAAGALRERFRLQRMPM